jgi:integrase
LTLKEVRVERVRLHKRRKPNKMYFTDRSLAGLMPKRDKQYLVWDYGKKTNSAAPDPMHGLACLVSPSGVKSFRCVYYFPNSPDPHWLHLGRLGELTLAEARDRCGDARRKARNSVDPKGGAADHSDSFKAKVEDYIQHEQIGRRKNKSAAKTQALMLAACKDWLPRSVATISFREIDKLLLTIRDGDEAQGLKPRGPLANRLHSHLKDFFGWCKRNRAIERNEMEGMAKPLDEMESRDRPWFKKDAADAAIKSLWTVADQVGSNEGKYIKLMVILGKRKTALAAMRWDEITPDWFWDAPESNSNKRLHGVPLPQLAQRVLSPRQAQGKVFGDINLDRLQQQLRKLTPIEDFFWHGLRHLAETKTAELKDDNKRPLIPPHVRDMLFDHSSKRGAGAGYDHHDYVPEMSTAMEAWAAYIEGLVTPPGTVRLRG